MSIFNSAINFNEEKIENPGQRFYIAGGHE